VQRFGDLRRFLERHVIELPPYVREKALSEGQSAWIEALPSLVAEIAAEWQITVGRTLHGGSEAYVAEATTSDATPAVLKVLIPRYDDVATNEITALRLANGEGCARLYRDDPARFAMLLERLGRSLFDLKLPIDQRHEILASTAMQLWRPAPNSGLPTGAEKGRWLIDFILKTWDEIDRPCSRRAVDYAIGCAERRIAAHDDERAVLVHGDVHQWNTLEAGNGRYKLVDPDGLLAEAEYDLGIIMREDSSEMLQGDPRDRARWLATRTGLNETAIWEWGAVERLSTGLLCTKLNMQPEAGYMLEVAERVAE
jgi:streptomycin 6-kinase